MSIQPITSNYCNAAPVFKGTKAPVLVDVRRNGDVEERHYETEASTGKKWGVGIASSFVTGLGQAVNGDWGKAAGFFFSALGLGAISYAIVRAGKHGLGRGLAVIGGLGLNIASIVDAVKNAKSTQVQIVPVENKD